MNIENNYQHPGLFYEVICTDPTSEILSKANGSPVEQQKQYIFLISESTEFSDTDPFINRRLKSVMDEIDVVVFDTPPLDEHYVSPLSKMDPEAIARIDKAFTEKLPCDVEGVDLLTKIMMKGAAIMIGHLEPCFQRNITTSMNPKQRILFTAKELNKQVCFMRTPDCENLFEMNERELAQKNHEFIEFVLTYVATDSQLMGELCHLMKQDLNIWQSGSTQTIDTKALESHPLLLKLKEMMPPSNSWIDDMTELAGKIHEYFLSKKKVLFVGDYSQKALSTLPLYFSMIANCDLKIRGPLKEPQGIFWKVKKEEKTVGYLLGSIHSTPNYLLHLNSRINKCFKKASRLDVEIDITREEIRNSLGEQIKEYLENRLKKLTPEQMENLTNTLKKIYPDCSGDDFILKGISKLKSSSLFLHKSGIDFELIRQAKELEKPIGDLETLQQHMKESKSDKGDLLSEIIIQVLASRVEDRDPEELLNTIIQKISDEGKSVLEGFYRAWDEGNLEEFDHSKTDSNEEKMIMTERNMNMAFKFIQNITSGEKPFACVGAAHTAGPMNMRDFLQQFGYTTVRI